MKKKVLSFVLALCMLASFVLALPITSSATGNSSEIQISYSDGFYFLTIDDTYAEIVGCEHDDYGVCIPDMLDDYIVTKISDSAFKDAKLEEIVIPDSITTIEDGAFAGCDYLETVFYTGTEEQWNAISIGENNGALVNADKVFNYIGEYVYAELENFEFTGSALEGTLVFDYADENSVAIIQIIDEYEEEIEKTFEIEIPAGTEEKEFSIPFKADDREHFIYISFVNNTTEKIEVGENIYDYFYAKIEKLTDGEYTYTLFDGNAEILSYSGNDDELAIPNTLGGYNVTGIGDSVFEYCYLRSVSIPNTVTHIGEYAFMGNEFREIIFPENLTYIGEGAFEGNFLREVTIPASVEEIGPSAFGYCLKLTEIKVDENNENYCSDDGNLYSKDKTELLAYAIGKTATSWEIPNTVTTVKFGALSGSEYLTDITIPNSVTTIEDHAFSGGLWETLTIPSTVSYIGEGAFCYCQNLTEIKIDENNENYCSDNGVVFNKDKTVIMQYPAGKTNIFYRLPDSVKTISRQSFSGALFKTIVFPASLETVGYAAFRGCDELKTVLYEGTEKEYMKLDFPSRNFELEEANVIFEIKGLSANIESVFCWYDNNKVTAKINFNYLEKAGKLYLAVYDNEKLVAIKSKSVALGETDNTIEILDADENYKNYSVKVFYLDVNSLLKPLAKTAEAEIVRAVVVDDVLESEHPYADDTDEIQKYVYDGECESISVTFTDDTETEWDCDYIYIYDADNNEIGKYSGTELAGRTITIPGNTVKIRLNSVSFYNEYYGYKTARIVVNK